MMIRSRALLGLLVLAGTTGGVLLACSEDGTTATTTDAGSDGAANHGDSGTLCPTQPTPSCSAAACATQFGGDAGFCVEGTCVQANTFDCTRVGGDLTGSNQVVIGAMLSYADGGTGISRANSLELAINEINKAGGIPDPDACKPARTLAFVECDDRFATGADAGAGVTATDRTRAGTHLLNDLKVPVILGGSTSGNTLAIAKTLTIPAKAMLFAPSSTAISITNPTAFNASPDGTRLLWRAAPSDVAQSTALQQVYALVELQVKTLGVMNPHVALVTKSDAYGAGIRAAFKTGFQINGVAPTGTNFADVVYQDPTVTPATDQTVAAAEAVVETFAPDIVVLVGTDEGNTGIVAPLEASGHHPYYLMSDGLKKQSLTTVLDNADGNAATSNSLQGRVRGTQPGVVTQQLTQNFFNLGYKTVYGASSILAYGMAGSYDIGYMLAYSIAATKGGAVTGTALSQNMSLLVGGTSGVDVGTAALSRGFTSMINGEKVDFNGASGPLDFDLTTGEAPSDYSIWCVKRDPNTPTSHIYLEVAGLSYSAKTKSLAGTYACPAE